MKDTKQIFPLKGETEKDLLIKMKGIILRSGDTKKSLPIKIYISEDGYMDLENTSRYLGLMKNTVMDMALICSCPHRGKNKRNISFNKEELDLWVSKNRFYFECERGNLSTRRAMLRNRSRKKPVLPPAAKKPWGAVRKMTKENLEKSKQMLYDGYKIREITKALKIHFVTFHRWIPVSVSNELREKGMKARLRKPTTC